MLLLNSVGTAASSLLYCITTGRNEVSEPVVADIAMHPCLHLLHQLCQASPVPLSIQVFSFRQTTLKAVLC